MLSDRAATAALLAATIGATLVVYSGILGCWFWADDVVFLFDLHDGTPLQFLLTPYGGHLSWFRNLVFATIEALGGPRPEPFFAVMLATHLANVVLLFLVVRVWTGSALLAAVLATLWGTSPRNGGSVNWFACQGLMMAGTMMLAMLWRAGVLLGRGEQPTTRDAWGAVALSIVGAGSFGVGLAVGMVVPVAALLLFPAMAWRPRAIFLSLLVLLPGLYVLALALNGIVSTKVMPAASFSVVDSLPLAVGLWLLMLGNGVVGLLANFVWAQTIPLAVGIAGCIVFWGALGGALAAADGRTRLRLLAVALLPLAIYGVIALGRAPLASMVGGVEPVASTPRYHYAGPLALTVLVALVCVEARRRLRLPAMAGPALALLLLAVDGIAFARTSWKLDPHAWVGRNTKKIFDELDAAAAAAPPGAPVVVPNARFAGVGPVYMMAPLHFPRSAGVFIAFRDGDTVDGHPVKFAEPDAKVYAALTADPARRIARLLVPGEPTP